MSLVIQARDIFDEEVVGAQVAVNGELLTPGAFEVPLPGANVTVGAVADGFQQVTETLVWDASAQTLSATSANRYLEVSRPDGLRWVCTVRFLRLKDASNEPLYRSFLPVLPLPENQPGRWGFVHPTYNRLPNASRQLLQPGPTLATSACVLPSRPAGRYFMFRRTLAGPPSAHSNIAARRSGAQVLHARRSAGAPRGVFVWVPPARAQGSDPLFAPRGLDFHVHFHPNPSSPFNTATPFESADGPPPVPGVHAISNQYQHVIGKYARADYRFIAQHLMAESAAAFVLPLGDRNGDHDEDRSPRELHRMLREIAYLARRAERTEAPPLDAIASVAVSCFSFGMSSLSTLVRGQYGPDQEFLRNKVKQVFDVDGHGDASDEHRILDWARQAGPCAIRSYRSQANNGRFAALFPTTLQLPAATTQGALNERHGRSGDIAVSLVWGPSEAWNDALPRPGADELLVKDYTYRQIGDADADGVRMQPLLNEDVHHTVPAYVLSHALSLGFS